MNRTGPTPQPLRFSGFASQQSSQNRNPSVGSARLQNSKLGNGTSWSFGGANNANGGPTIQSLQGRQPGAGSSSFAQTIGGSQNATPLDLSEFPSLSGAPQPHYHNAGQAVWANANQRAVQHTPVQRPQQQLPVSAQSNDQQQQHTHQGQDSAQRGADDLFTASSQFACGLEDYRNGGQGGVGQLSGTGQPQTGNIEEFPPLARNGTDEAGQDRRGSLMQNAAFGNFPNPNNFNLSQNSIQSHQGLQNASSNQAERISSTLADRIMSPGVMGFGATTRSPGDSIRPNQGAMPEQEKNGVSAGRERDQAGHNFQNLLPNFQDSQPTAQQPSQSQQQMRLQQSYRSAPPDSPAATPEQGSHLSELDRFGLAGLLATVRSGNPDIASLAIGQDLNQLGLNLNSIEPLYPTFAGPFAESGSRPLQPDFKLPECYTVDNVHRVREKIPGFSDETLFWIFYTQPRDIMQELAATELTNRNWRYHKELMMWLTKDPAFPEPTPISTEAERGSYIFFNHQTWQRARSEFVLNYDALDSHIPVRQNGAMA